MIHRDQRSRIIAPPGSEALIGTLFDNDFEVKEWIGGGAFSNVYRAAQKSMEGRIVALKVIQKGHSQMARRRSRLDDTHAFGHEVRFNQMLKHPIIARAMRAGCTSDKVDYIVMEYVQGPQLDVYIRKHGPLPFLHIAKMGIDILECLVEAHALGFAHGDLKSGNIIVKSVHAAGLRLKLLDLGHARSFRSTARLKNHMVGTPAFLAPELADGGLVDPRAELFALGAILYIAVTGERHVQTKRNSAEECLEYLREPKFPIPSHPVQQYRPGCPDDLTALIEWLLQRNRKARPPSAKELLTPFYKAISTCPMPRESEKKGGFVRRMTGAWSDIFERFSEDS